MDNDKLQELDKKISKQHPLNVDKSDTQIYAIRTILYTIVTVWLRFFKDRDIRVLFVSLPHTNKVEFDFINTLLNQCKDLSQSDAESATQFAAKSAAKFADLVAAKSANCVSVVSDNKFAKSAKECADCAAKCVADLSNCEDCAANFAKFADLSDFALFYLINTYISYLKTSTPENHKIYTPFF